MAFLSHFYGTAAVLAARNPLVPKGGVAAESDTGVIKIGDGVTRYNSLSTALSSTYVQLTQEIKGWALSASFYFSGMPTANTAGVITSGNITWPDGATGVYTATSTDSNGAVTAFTATTTGGSLGSKTVTVTIPRDSSSIINGAMTVTVS